MIIMRIDIRMIRILIIIPYKVHWDLFYLGYWVTTEIIMNTYKYRTSRNPVLKRIINQDNNEKMIMIVLIIPYKVQWEVFYLGSWVKSNTKKDTNPINQDNNERMIRILIIIPYRVQWELFYLGSWITKEMIINTYKYRTSTNPIQKRRLIISIKIIMRGW